MIANDLEWGADTGDLEGAVVLGQGPRPGPPEQHEAEDPEHDRHHLRSKEPAKQGQQEAAPGGG